MRVAVVGCGRMGRERAMAAASFGVQSVLLFDEDSGRAESLAAECSKFRTLRDSNAIFDHRVDVIFICTPPLCRGPIELRAIDAGIPFLVEKPIGIRAEQAQSILQNLSRTSLLTAVGYMNRYRNSVSCAKTILRSRTIIGISAHWAGRKYGVPWWGIMEQSGGPFNEQATHVIDLFQHLTGSAEPLYAVADSAGQMETTVVAVMRLSGNAFGSVLYSCGAKEKDIFIVIETTEGMLELRGWDLDLVRNTLDDTRPEPESKPIFEKETHSFLQAVAMGNRNLILIDFEEAYRTQIVMDRLVRLIRSEQIMGS